MIYLILCQKPECLVAWVDKKLFVRKSTNNKNYYVIGSSADLSFGSPSVYSLQTTLLRPGRFLLCANVLKLFYVKTLNCCDHLKEVRYAEINSKGNPKFHSAVTPTFHVERLLVLQPSTLSQCVDVDDDGSLKFEEILTKPTDDLRKLK